MDECVHCQLPRDRHIGLLRECPGHRYHMYRARYNADGSFVTEREDVIVCPHCGHRDSEWWESGAKPDETERLTCPECEQVFDCECEVEYYFTTTVPDLEAEARERAEREAQRARERQEFLARVQDFPPGTRVRVVGERGIYLGREGTIANKEVDSHYNLIDVDFDDGRRSCFYLKHLEAI